MTVTGRSLLLWLVIVLIAIGVFARFHDRQTDNEQVVVIPFSEHEKEVREGRIGYVYIGHLGAQIDGHYLDEHDNWFQTFKAPDDDSYYDLLRANHVPFDVEPPHQQSSFASGWLIYVPLLVLLVLWVTFMVQMKRGSPDWKKMSESPATRVDSSEATLGYVDVVGCDDAKTTLVELTSGLTAKTTDASSEPEPIRRVLLHGPPGCGKSLLTQALAKESGISVFMAPASRFVEMFVGTGASRVRKCFVEAAEARPAILVIDDLDGIAKQRASLDRGVDEREQCLVELLQQLETLAPRVGFVATSNRVELLDDALLRPGRIDRSVLVDVPSTAERAESIRRRLHGRDVAVDVDIDRLAELTAGLSHASLRRVIDDASLAAGDAAIDRAGLERAQRRMRTPVATNS